MMRLLPGIALLLLGAAAPLHAQVAKSDQYEALGQPEQVDSTSQATDVRFKKDPHERMTVPVRVAGQGPYRFLIDTGADRSAISGELARRLRLADGPGAMLHTILGRGQVATALVSVLDVTAKRVTNVEAAVLDPVHMGADGILGLDSLRSQRIQFDFKRRTLTIVPSHVKVRRDRNDIVVTGRVRNGRFILADARAENTRVTLVVDTGAEISVGNDALRQRLLRRGNVKRTGQVELHSVLGEKLIGEYLIVRELEIGGVTLKDLPIVFADSRGFEPLGLADKPALLLGMNALKGFEKVSIDFARRKLRVVLPRESALRGYMLASR